MSTALLIGNGLNLCIKDNLSWGDLLKGIAEELHVPYNGSVSMPLEFECIVNRYLSQQSDPTDKIYLVIKGKISKIMSDAKLPSDTIHHMIPLLTVDAIMTTNYDNLIEYAYDPAYSYKGKKDKTYLFDATSNSHGISFFHIHGHVDNPKTICLGYEHYMGLVEKMRVAINSKSEGSEGKRMKIVEALVDPTKRRKTWDEKFYTDDISIIGLGLSESEVDLWWLLTHRAYLYYSNYHGARDVLTNKITYYDILDESDEDRLAQKKRIHYLLKNTHVEVIAYTIGKDCVNYEDGYRQILQLYMEKLNNRSTRIGLNNRKDD